MAPRCGRGPAYAIGPKTQAFREQFYPHVPEKDWNNWRWQIKNRISSLKEMSRLIHLSPDEQTTTESHRVPLPLRITPYYASLIDENDPGQGLRRAVVPAITEYQRSPGEADDPLGEETHSPVPGLVHRYPDRVLFLVTNFCSTYCRYCTRSRIVGRGHEHQFKMRHWQAALDYIAATPVVRDVLLSGGDPLTMSDNKLEWLLIKLRAIPHVEFIRIGTKVPVALPQRITPALTRMLRRYHPLWMSLHFTHPEEFTPEVKQACGRLADAGIPLGSQTVLLKGVNDDLETMRNLVHGLLQMRVRPYYLYQCDPISGSAHFRTTVDQGLEIIRGLRGYTSGYAVPTYVVDAPGGGGKIPLLPDPVIGRQAGDLLLENYEGKRFRYPDTGGTLTAKAANHPTAAAKDARMR